MPLTWSISHDERLVIAVADGEVPLADVEHYLTEVAAAGAMPYRKVFDMSHVFSGSLGIKDLKALGVTMVAYGKLGPVGALAIVVKTELEHEAAQIYGKVATAGRVVSVFTDLSKAREWLDGLAPEMN